MIDWAQSTSPLPPVLGGRASPAGYSSLLGGRCALREGGWWLMPRGRKPARANGCCSLSWLGSTAMPSSQVPAAARTRAPTHNVHIIHCPNRAGCPLAVAAAAWCLPWPMPPTSCVPPWAPCPTQRGRAPRPRQAQRRPAFLPASGCRWPALRAAPRSPPQPSCGEARAGCCAVAARCMERANWRPKAAAGSTVQVTLPCSRHETRLFCTNYLAAAWPLLSCPHSSRPLTDPPDHPY